MFQIIRFYRDNPDGNEVIKTVATKEEAMEWCTREDTQGDGWFDGWHEVSA